MIFIIYQDVSKGKKVAEKFPWYRQMFYLPFVIAEGTEMSIYRLFCLVFKYDRIF